MYSYRRKVIALDTKVQVIKSTDSLSFDVWLRADDVPASKAVNFVFYYESIDNSSDSKIRYGSRFNVDIHLRIYRYLQT